MKKIVFVIGSSIFIILLIIKLGYFDENEIIFNKTISINKPDYFYIDKSYKNFEEFKYTKNILLDEVKHDTVQIIFKRIIPSEFISFSITPISIQLNTKEDIVKVFGHYDKKVGEIYIQKSENPFKYRILLNNDKYIISIISSSKELLNKFINSIKINKDHPFSSTRSHSSHDGSAYGSQINSNGEIHR